MTFFTKVPDCPSKFRFWTTFEPKFLSGNIIDVFKLNDIACATLYLSFTTKIEALSVLVLKI